MTNTDLKFTHSLDTRSLHDGHVPRWRDTVGSISPLIRQFLTSVSPAAISLAFAVPLSFGLNDRVAAQDSCSPSTGTLGASVVVCSDGGATTDQEQFFRNTGGPLTVTVNPGFNVDATVNVSDVTGPGRPSGTHGFDLTASGGLTFSQSDDQAIIEGADRGILATNFSSGDLSVNVEASVIGNGRYGIDARGYGRDMSLVIGGNVTGTQAAIIALNEGSGALSVTTSGVVTGGAFGISARNFIPGFGAPTPSFTDVIVKAHSDVNASSTATAGISVGNGGTGKTHVSAYGDINVGPGVGNGASGINVNASNGTNTRIVAEGDIVAGQGIRARTDYTSGYTSITASGTITAQSFGIRGHAFGGTSLAITAKESVTVQGGDGIRTRSGVSGGVTITAGAQVSAGRFGVYAQTVRNVGTDLSINVADVEGGAGGIFAEHLAGGALSIKSSGSVVGGQTFLITSGNGVSAETGASGSSLTINVVNVSGEKHGIYARHNGAGLLSITSSGNVIGKDEDGINAQNAVSDLTIDVANVTGKERGIYANNYEAGLLSITASGDVIGENSSGIFASNGRPPNQTLTYTSTPDLAGDAFSYSASGNIGSAMSIGYKPDERDVGLKIDVVNVTGGSYGIQAINFDETRFGPPVGGNVGLSINARGRVTGETLDGISATNGPGPLTLDVVDVTGARDGIRTVQFSQSTRFFSVSAPLNVRISGDVLGGSGYGVYNTAASQGGTFTITQSGSLSAQSGVAFLDASMTLDAIEGFSLIGADSRLIVEGALNGDALMGAGSDTIKISGKAATLGASVVLDGGGFGIQAVEPQPRPESFLQEVPIDIIIPPIVPPISALSETDRLFFDGWSGSIDAAQMVNWEEVIVTGGSEVVFSDAIMPGSGLRNEYTLRGIMFNDLLFQVDEGSIARFAGDFAIEGDVNNFGTLDLSGANGTADTSLIIARDYTAASTLILDVELGDDSSPSDVLVIRGDTSGTTSVVINNTGGTGALTTGDGIRVIDTDPSNTLDGEFVLAGPVIAGAFEYDLQLGPLMGPSSDDYPLQSARMASADDGDWYLRSSGFQPGAPVYEALPSVLLGLNTAGTLAQRIEGRQVLSGGNGTSVGIATRGVAATAHGSTQYAAWLRVEGSRYDLTPETASTGLSYDQNTWRLQGGLDMLIYEGDGGALIAGVNLFTGGGSADVIATIGGGTISTDAKGIGLTATWYGNRGFYADGQLQYTRLNSDLSSNVLGPLSTDLDGSGRLASIEMGQEFVLPSGLTLTPQAQMTWSEVSFDTFAGPNGETVALSDDDSLQLRLGLGAERAWDFGSGERARLYGIANVVHEMRSATSVIVSGTELTSNAPDWIGEIGLGGSYDWDREGGGTSSLYGEVSASRELSGGKMRGLSGTIGLRLEF